VGEMRNYFRILVGSLKGRNLFGGCTHRGEDNIKMNLREIWLKGV
jgi:hypothetical protein